MNKYSVLAGRCITKNGKPFVTIQGASSGDGSSGPADWDAFARVLPKLIDFVQAVANGTPEESKYQFVVAQAVLRELEGG